MDVTVGQGGSQRSARARALSVVHIATLPQTALRLLPELVSEQHRRGHSIAILVGSDGWAEVAEVRRSIDVEVSSIGLRRAALSPAADLRALVLTILQLRRIRPDIVVGHTPKAAFVAMLAAWIVRTPTRIYTVHGARYVTVTGIARRALVIFERLTHRLATRSLCVSESLRETFVDDGIGATSEFDVLGAGSHTGVDCNRFAPDPNRRDRFRSAMGVEEPAYVLGFVGRWEQDKGIEALRACWRILIDEWDGPEELCLVLAGPGCDTSVERLLSDEIVEGRHKVIALGNLSDPSDLFRSLDILLFPSHREGFGNVVIEAAATGVPTVGFDVVGTRDSVSTENGLTVPDGDSGRMAGAVLGLLSSEDQLRQLGRRARRRALRDFEQDRVIERIAAYYEGAAKYRHDT